MNINQALIPGRFLTIDWLRLEDDTICSLNGQIIRQPDGELIWLSKTAQARLTLRGSKVKARTQNRINGRHKENAPDDKGMSYWTIPVERIIRVKSNKKDYS